MKQLLLAFVLLFAICLPAAASSPHYTLVSWQPGGAYSGDQFRVYKSSDNVTFALVAITNLPVLSLQDNAVQPNKTYYYYVTAYDTATKVESPKSLVVTWTVGP